MRAVTILCVVAIAALASASPAHFLISKSPEALGQKWHFSVVAGNGEK
jgi:hypothetical protein